MLPLSLRLTFWTCPDECSYECMHNLTDRNTVPSPRSFSINIQQQLYDLEGLPPREVVQFHGKWPFYRLWGIQEPLSVLFSLMNLYMHVKYGYLMLRRQLPRNLPRPLATAYRILPLVGINLWVWSSVFHTRDRPWTEKLDYFSSALNMMCNLYVAIVRIGGLYPPPSGSHHHRRTSSSSSQRKKTLARGVLLASLATIYLAHVSYLSFWKFDYGYNMVFNVSLGLLHNLLWSAWSGYHLLSPYLAKTPKRRLQDNQPRARARPPHYARPFVVLTAFTSFSALELLDFPPLFRALDAHALWHLSTVLIVKWWYLCLLEDARWLCGREEGQQQPTIDDKTRRES